MYRGRTTTFITPGKLLLDEGGENQEDAEQNPADVQINDTKVFFS